MSKRSSVVTMATENDSKKVRLTPQHAKDALARIKASIIENDTKIDFGAAKSVVEGLLHPKTADEFTATYWEKKPMHVKRNQKDYYGTAFTLASLKKIVEDNELTFAEDIEAFRFNNNEKEILSETGTLNLATIEKLLDKEKATVQFHQPQRYTDVVWNILEKMETFFGTLVGANAYITPANSQGLAPHCDETETIVLQLEGSMEWSIYEPKVPLARDGTHDLNKEVIGEPQLSVVLETGDLLYVPRGYVHQAVNKADTSSTRIEICTYQGNAWGDFMNLAVNQAIENALESDVSFRTGLPIQFSSYLGTGKNLQKYIDVPKPTPETESILTKNESNDKVVDFKQQMKKRLAKLVDHIDVDAVADSLNSEFIANRLPPFEYVPKSEYTSPMLTDQIILKFKDHIKVLYYAEDDEINTTRMGYSTETEDELTEDEATEDEATEDEEMVSEDEKAAEPPKKPKSTSEEQDEDDDDDYMDTAGNESTCVKVIHSLHNDRKTHMYTSEETAKPTSLRFPIHYAAAIVKLIESSEYTTVSDLPSLDEETDKLNLVTSLYDADLIDIKPRPSR